MMTRNQFRAAVAALECISAREIDGEIRVNYRGGAEQTAYYTNDRDDALATAMRMAGERSKRIAGEILSRDDLLAAAVSHARHSGTCEPAGFRLDDDHTRVAYSMGGAYTVDELAAILSDVRAVQAEYDRLRIRNGARQCEHHQGGKQCERPALGGNRYCIEHWS